MNGISIRKSYAFGLVVLGGTFWVVRCDSWKLRNEGRVVRVAFYEFVVGTLNGVRSHHGLWQRDLLYHLSKGLHHLRLEC